MARKPLQLAAWCVAVLALFAGITVVLSARYYLSSTHPGTVSSREPESAPAQQTKCFIRKTFLDDDGSAHPYMVFVPSSMKPSDRLPLMIYLNGLGENGNDGLAPLYNALALAVWERQHDFPFIVAFVQCDKDDSWTADGPSSSRAIQIMRQVADEFHTDPGRLYLSGISTGGSGTWSIAGKHPDLFAAIVPVSGAPSEPDAKRVAEANLPVWAYFVAEDKEYFVEANRRSRQALIEWGTSPHFTELRVSRSLGIMEHDAWSFAYRDAALYRWLAVQNRSDRLKNVRNYTVVDPATLPSTVETSPAAAALQSDQSDAPGGPSESQAKHLPTLSQLPVRRLVELHLEFKPTAGVKRFGVGLFEATVENPQVGSVIEFAIDDLSCGGHFARPGGHCIDAAKPVAERLVRIDAWNDLRIRFSNGRVSVELNGMELLDDSQLSSPTANAFVGFIADGDGASHIDLQNLRYLRDEETEAHTNMAAQDSIASSNARASGDTIAPIDVSVVSEAWTRRERSFSHLDIRWIEGDESPCAKALFQSKDGSESEEAVAKPGRLVLSPDGVDYSTTWQHSLVDFWRNGGVPCAPESLGYLRAFGKGFKVPAEPVLDSLRYTVHSDIGQRIDTLFDESGQVNQAFVDKNPQSASDRVAAIDDIIWRAPLLAFRPLSRAGIGCRLEACHVASNNAIVAGVRCLVLEETTRVSGTEFKRRFWVDPLRDFLIVRATVTVDGLFREQLDVEYSQDSTQLWLPASWTAIAKPIAPAPALSHRFPGDDWLFAMSSAEVTECRVGSSSAEIPSVPAFRKGTIVFDKVSGEWSVVEEQRKLTANEIRTLTFGNE